MALLIMWLIPLAFAVLGFAVGDWRVIAVPVAVVGLATGFLIINNGWYGAGWGDFGIAMNIFVAILSIALTAVGVAVRKALSSGHTGGSVARS